MIILVTGASHSGKTALAQKLLGGDLTVNYTDERVRLTGSAVMVFEGEFEY